VAVHPHDVCRYVDAPPLPTDTVYSTVGINVPVTFRLSALLADVQISLAWAWFIYYCSSAATHREEYDMGSERVS